MWYGVLRQREGWKQAAALPPLALCGMKDIQFSHVLPVSNVEGFSEMEVSGSAMGHQVKGRGDPSRGYGVGSMVSGLIEYLTETQRTSSPVNARA